MNEVLEIVSPDILGWNGLTRPQEQYALEETNAIYNLAANSQTRSESNLKEEKHSEGILRFGCTS
jgi:hypothetical protein